MNMPKFKFRLQSLLKLREAERQQCRMELAEAFQAESILYQQRHQLAQQIDEMTKRARVAGSPGKIQIDQLLDAHRYRSVLEAQTKMLQQRETQITGEITRRREALADADRDVRVLEKLRDRKLDEHRAAELQRELKQLDEVAVQRWERDEESIR
jgi:flagellar FliJ protein